MKRHAMPQHVLVLALALSGVLSAPGSGSAHAAGVPTWDPDAAAAPADSLPPVILERVDGLPFDAGVDYTEGTRADAAAGEKRAAASIRVKGRLVYRRPTGVLEGVDGQTIWVREDDSGDLCFSGWLGFDQTDQNGYFDFIVEWPSRDAWCDQDPDIFLRINAGPYTTLETETIWDYRGTFIDYGTISTDSSTATEQFHITSVNSRVVRWLASRGYPFVPSYESAPQGPLAPYDNWNDPVIARRAAERWMFQHDALYIVDLCNGSCDGSGSIYCDYCTWCPENQPGAWQKGVAEWIAEQALTDASLGYELPAWLTKDFETLGDCGLVPVTPWETAGVVAACLHDMSDSVDEDDPAFPAGRDAMGWGPDFILQIVAEDKPYTPGEFFADFRARYPEACEQMWLTAANVGYYLDGLPPNAITGLGSSSHTPGVWSTNARVSLNWTEPADDCFASKQYSVTVAATPQLPDNVAELGDVSSWTTGVLAPGNWYICLRVGDLAGNWRTDYATFGPVVIAAPTPANLGPAAHAGWGGPVVPRGSSNSTIASVPTPTTLTGNTAATWWNVALQNYGTSSTGVASGVWVLADGKGFYSPINPPQYAASVPVLAGLQTWQGINLGPLYLRGGRHSFGAYCDFTGLVAESDENDNVWARQWVWTPYELAAGGVTYRLAPPSRSGGWDDTVGTLYYNCDGVRFTTSGWWNALTLLPSANTTDYDARLHTATTAATNGFGLNAGWSSRPAGYLDAVFVNRNQTGAVEPWDVGIIQTRDFDYSSGYQAQHIVSVEQAYGDSVTVTLGPYEALSLREVYLSAGWHSAVVRLIDGQGPLHLSWLASDFVTGGMDDTDATAAADAYGVTRLEVNPVGGTYNGFAIHRDPKDADISQPVTFTFQVVATPPDFKPTQPAGWAGSIVPRPSYGGLPGSVPAPATLTGWAAATWLNVASINDSPVAASLPTDNRVLLDGAVVYTQAVPSYTAGGSSLLQPASPIYVPGGLHTLSLRTDAPGERTEISETNNNGAVQYGWSPQSLLLGPAVNLPHPPDPFGGWSDLAAGPYWPNSFGYRTPTFMPGAGDGTWAAVATVAADTSEVDLRLHDADDNPATAFTVPLATSSLGGRRTDFVVIDLGATNSRTFDVGVTHASGVQTHDLGVATSAFLGTEPSGSHGPYVLPAGMLIGLHEVELSGGFMRVRLVNLSPDANLDVTVFPPEGTAFGPQDAVEGGRGADSGAGGDEWVIVPVAVGGSYCVAVTKAGHGELDQGCSYRLEFQSVSNVGDTVPVTRTALVGAHPNPFNPQTTVAFDLAAAGEVSLDIFDLAGRRVRRLAHGAFAAGHHEVVWNGQDERGQGMASGVYVVRFTQGNLREHTKISLMK